MILELTASEVEARRPLVILLVEDTLDDIMLAEMAFDAIPLKVIYIERDGQAALDFLLRRGKHASDTSRLPDIVLLDLNLPKLNGIEVLKTIRAEARLATLPVIILSASGREEDIQSAYRYGANTYVQKPVEFARFQSAVLLLHQYWSEIANLPAAA